MMAVTRIYLLLSGLIFLGCQTPGIDPAEIIRKSIQFSGGRISDGKLEFMVRGRHYLYARQGEVITLERSFQDSTALIRDILNKKGFMRMVDSLTEILPDSTSHQLAETLKAEMLMALLPFSLEEYGGASIAMGLDSIGRELLFRIRIPLDADGGSERLDCWFNPDSGELRFAAYAHPAWDEGPWFYHVTGHQTSGGVRFSDYIRFRPDETSAPFDSLGRYYNAKRLKFMDTLRMLSIKAEFY